MKSQVQKISEDLKLLRHETQLNHFAVDMASQKRASVPLSGPTLLNLIDMEIFRSQREYRRIQENLRWSIDQFCRKHLRESEQPVSQPTARFPGRKSKLQAMGDTTLLCPVYGCETEGGVLFTKPSATTLGEHNAQFQTCRVSAKEFCSAVTKAT